jgi:hypothetical protein
MKSVFEEVYRRHYINIQCDFSNDCIMGDGEGHIQLTMLWCKQGEADYQYFRKCYGEDWERREGILRGYGLRVLNSWSQVERLGLPLGWGIVDSVRDVLGRNSFYEEQDTILAAKLLDEI